MWSWVIMIHDFRNKQTSTNQWIRFVYVWIRRFSFQLVKSLGSNFNVLVLSILSLVTLLSVLNTTKVHVEYFTWHLRDNAVTHFRWMNIWQWTQVTASALLHTDPVHCSQYDSLFSTLAMNSWPSRRIARCDGSILRSYLGVDSLTFTWWLNTNRWIRVKPKKVFLEYREIKNEFQWNW